MSNFKGQPQSKKLDKALSQALDFLGPERTLALLYDRLEAHYSVTGNANRNAHIKQLLTHLLECLNEAGKLRGNGPATQTLKHTLEAK